MTVSIKDGAGTTVALKSSTDGSDQVPHHIVEGVALGTVTETAPASDTASSGLNGRMQRLAQHLSTFLGYFKAEDGAHTTGDMGMPVFPGIRKDVAATLVGTDQDYTFFQFDNAGAARVTVTSVLAGTGTTSLGKAEDAAHTSGDTMVAIAGVRQDTPGTSVSATNDYTAFQMDAYGGVRITGGFASGTISNTDVDTLEDVATIPVHGKSRLNLSFTVATAVLSNFVVQFRDHSSGAWCDMATVSTDYTTPDGPILGSSGDLTTAGTSGTHWLALDVQGYESIRLRAAGTSSVIAGTWGAV